MTAQRAGIRNRGRTVFRAAAHALVLLLTAVPLAGAQERITVRTEPGTPVVAAEILVSAGPADELSFQPGLAYLASRAVTAQVLPRLDSLGAHLAVRAYKDALGFTVVAAPEAWEEASRTLLVALFRDPIDSVAVIRERDAIRRELIGREANPNDALAREVDAALFGSAHPWGRSEVGYADTVSRISVAEVDQFLRNSLTPERAVAAVVGPVEAGEATRFLIPFLGTEPREVLPALPVQRAELPVRRDYNSITTWVAVSYPLPAEPDLEALGLLSDLVARSLSFGPRQRSVYDVQSEVIPRIGDGEVRIRMVVPPGEAGQWAERIQQALARYADEPIADRTFAERLRHYRGRRLLDLSAPEERAHAAARQLLLGRARGPLTELETLTPQRLQTAARTLQPPVVVILGPKQDQAD